ncbi:hypothetical protein BSKO_05269 [Bryopsis sp. KO-2023]|nr:hypothetical protein BSKO_05269 [Bryopsis sp. KO-2023]
MDRGRRFYNADDSDLEAELDPAYLWDAPHASNEVIQAAAFAARLTQSKSKDSLRSQDGKELNTTFQFLGIDAYLLKKDITASSHIPFTNAASCGTSTFVSESDSEASTYSCSTSVSGLTGRTRRRSTSASYHINFISLKCVQMLDMVHALLQRFIIFVLQNLEIQTTIPQFCSGSAGRMNKLLEGFSEEFYSNSIPEKVKEAEMRGKEALDSLAELEDWDLIHGEHHEKWISTITDSLNEAQHVSREMRFSMPDPVSGSVETINSITEEGERIVAVLGGLIQTLYERIHERAIECALGMVPCFKIRDEVMLKKAFRSTGKLLRSCQYLSESEAQLSMPGVSQFYFCLVMPPHSKGRLQEALRRLLESASSATFAFQSCLLVEDNLTPSAGKSNHEISKASQLLSLCWNGCLDLVSALSGDSELKYAALHQFAKTVSSAAAHASAMQQPFQGIIVFFARSQHLDE